MQYKTLGNTGLSVSTLCFGTMTFHGGTGRFQLVGQVDQKGADELVKGSIDAGINFFDTADVYSEGESEKTLGTSLKRLNIARKDVVIATKAFARVGPGVNDIGASRGHIMDSIHGSLQRLQTDHIDLYQIHGNDSITPIDETLRALDDLVRSGKVRYIGVSNWEAWKLAKALTISKFRGSRDLIHCRLTTRSREEIWNGKLCPCCGRRRRACSFGVLWQEDCFQANSAGRTRSRKEHGGRMFDLPLVDKERTWKILDAMKPIAEAHGCSAARISLAWLLTKPVVTSVIIGAKRLDQLEDNIAAVDVKLTPQEVATLDEVSALPPEYPGWILQYQNAERVAALMT